MYGIYEPVKKIWLCAVTPIFCYEFIFSSDVSEALTFPTEIKAAAYLRENGGLPFHVEIRKIENEKEN